MSSGSCGVWVRRRDRSPDYQTSCDCADEVGDEVPTGVVVPADVCSVVGKRGGELDHFVERPEPQCETGCQDDEVLAAMGSQARHSEDAPGRAGHDQAHVGMYEVVVLQVVGT